MEWLIFIALWVILTSWDKQDKKRAQDSDKELLAAFVAGIDKAERECEEKY